MEKLNTNKIYFVTDRGMTLSDSISRYIIDLAEGFVRQGKDVTIFTSNESKRNDYILRPGVKYVEHMPSPNDDAVYHFHLTYTVRQHTQFFLQNVEKLCKKTVVTIHVTPEYAEIMHQTETMNLLLMNIINHSILVHCLSNYGKYDLKRFGVTKTWSVYPGLDTRRYKSVLPDTKAKKKQIMVVASNPNSAFVNTVKGFDLLDNLEGKFIGYTLRRVVNMSFEDYLREMAQSEYYLALAKVENYPFAIIDAYNLLTIPIYTNEGGLTEAVYSNGVPILANGKGIDAPYVLEYDKKVAINNHNFSKIEHTLTHHLEKMSKLYSLLTVYN